MAKLINILAASIGGGLVLGAGIRLGEALAAQLPVPPVESDKKLAERIGELENRLLSLEVENPADIGHGPELEHQTSVPDAVRHIDAVSETTLRLRGELRGWLEESVAARMAEVETRLRTDSERSQKQMLDAFTESVQTRVIQRISRVEEEVASQSAATNELRECSLRTERSVQKLLGVLDKLIVKNPQAAAEGERGDLNPAAAAGSHTAAEITPAESGAMPGVELPPPEAAPVIPPAPPLVGGPPTFEVLTKSRRWKIFG